MAEACDHAGALSLENGADVQVAATTWDAAWAGGAGAAEGPLLPFWRDAGEQPDHRITVFSFHTQACADFQSGYCSRHRPKGKASPCFSYHFESQQRRPPVEQSTGRLLYWDAPCQSIDAGTTVCPHGKSCVFAHSREEISYHPAKYKTRRCNGRGCRGDAVCCFAHSEGELRTWAPERYSYWVLLTPSSRSALALGGAALDEWPTPSRAAEWRRPAPSSRSQLPATNHKQRFCASYPDVAQCRRGAACAFAHSRAEAEMCTPLLDIVQEQQDPSALTEDFFMYKFKTLWCPVGVQHDWQTCVYAHNYQDARRRVSIGYGPRPCPYWAKKDPNAEYSQRCPLGLRCPYSHGAKEQLYHPQYFRTVICRDLRTKSCPRLKLCAFFHKRGEKRKPPADVCDYSLPLKEGALPEKWVQSFLSPPFRDAVPPNSGNEALALPDDLLAEEGGYDARGSEEPAYEEQGGYDGAFAGSGAFWCGGYGFGSPYSPQSVDFTQVGPGKEEEAGKVGGLRTFHNWDGSTTDDDESMFRMSPPHGPQERPGGDLEPTKLSIPPLVDESEMEGSPRVKAGLSAPFQSRAWASPLGLGESSYQLFPSPRRKLFPPARTGNPFDAFHSALFPPQNGSSTGPASWQDSSWPDMTPNAMWASGGKDDENSSSWWPTP